MEKITDENVLEVFLRVAGQIWDGLELYEEEDLSDLKLLFNPNKPFKMYFCAVGKPPLITGVFTCFEQDPKRDIYALYCDNFWKILEFWYGIFSDMKSKVDNVTLDSITLEYLEDAIDSFRKTMRDSLHNTFYEGKNRNLNKISDVKGDIAKGFLARSFLVNYENVKLEDLSAHFLNVIMDHVEQSKEAGRGVRLMQKPDNQKRIYKEKSEAKIKVYGTYLFPQYWIGEKHYINIILKEVKRASSLLGSFNYEKNLGDTVCRYSFDGYITVEKDEKTKAFEFLNKLCFVLNYRGFNVHSVKEADVFTNEIIPSEWRIADFPLVREMAHAMDLSEEHRVILAEEPVTWVRDVKSTYISEKDFEAALDGVLLIGEIPFEYIGLYVNAVTQFSYGNFNECHILSWVIIESVIEDILKRNLVDAVRERTGEEPSQKFLEKTFSANFLASTRINLALGWGLIPWEWKASLRKIRKARNYFIHDNKPVSEAEATSCKDMALEFLKNRYVGIQAL